MEYIFKNLRRLDLSDLNVQDCLYRIGDWMETEGNTLQDDYVQKKMQYLHSLIQEAIRENKIKNYKKSSGSFLFGYIEEFDYEENRLSR